MGVGGAVGRHHAAAWPLIVARWPVNSVYILGLFLGLDLIMAGAGWISLGLRLKAASLNALGIGNSTQDRRAELR